MMDNARLTLKSVPRTGGDSYANKGECVDVFVSIGGQEVPMDGYTDDDLNIGDLAQLVLRDSTIILTCDSEGFRKVVRLHAEPKTGKFLFADDEDRKIPIRR
jgi:hypothetical protein